MSNFVVYKSGAGSGKTFTLVKEFLRLALHDPSRLSWHYKRILAVTFTNKAAAEMKQRVIGTLHDTVHGSELPGIAQRLCEELKISADELKRRSAILLMEVLHNYSDLSIGTIDSFTHKIVKTFAHDLELPVNFNLETDTNSFYEKVVSELLAKIGEDEYVTKLLKEYSISKTEDSASWDPEKNLLQFTELLQKENAPYFLEKLSKYSAADLESLRRKIRASIASYKEKLRAMGTEALELLEREQVQVSDLWMASKSPVLFFSNCVTGDVKLEDCNKGYLAKVLVANNWLKAPDKKPLNEKLSARASEIIRFLEKEYPAYVLNNLVNAQIYRIMLVKKINEICLEKKEEEQIVFISEFNQKIFGLINHEPTPFIYERLGERYHHYLLDEFQDTSALQWQNILPLLDNSLASGWFNLIVGDGKQSIYRWRNADVKQFALLPKVDNPTGSAVIAERAAGLARNYRSENLGANYRSSRTVVDFNNCIFESLSSTLLCGEYSGIYEGQAQKITNEREGYVTVHTGRQARDEHDAHQCGLVKAHIDAAIADGYQYGDVCIISRFKQPANLLAAYLLEHNIPVVSSDSLLMKGKPEITALVSFLSYLDNPEDQVSAAAVLHYLLISEKINEQQFNGCLRQLKQLSLFQILNELGYPCQEHEFALRNLFDNCVHIITLLGLHKTNELYIRFFLDEVNSFLLTGSSNLLHFLQWWDNRQDSASVVMQEDSGAVKIMTIHASKGLEFPVVIIPYCNWPQYKSSETWLDLGQRADLPVAVIQLGEKAKEAGLGPELDKEKQEQHLDNLNLLYVAFTRAAERLHIITCQADTNRQKLVNEWINHYLQQFGQQDLYEFGSRQPAHKKSSAGNPSFSLAPLQFGSTAGIIKIKSAFLNEERETARKQGVVLHQILSNIHTHADTGEALARAHLEGLISLEELPLMQNRIEALLQHPLLKVCYAEGCIAFTEREMITSKGEVLRPDRIVITPDCVFLIDYKTGSENNNRYFKQLLRYADALREMGHSKVLPILAYIDSGEVVALQQQNN